MKRTLVTALLALPLLAGPARAIGWPPFKIEAGANVYLHVYNPKCCGAQFGPWYNYWPLEAHFQVPAIPQYPYWPAPQTLPPAMMTGGVPGPANFHAPVAPVGYVPPYWYGH